MGRIRVTVKPRGETVGTTLKALEVQTRHTYDYQGQVLAFTSFVFRHFVEMHVRCCLLARQQKGECLDTFSSSSSLSFNLSKNDQVLTAHRSPSTGNRAPLPGCLSLSLSIYLSSLSLSLALSVSLSLYISLSPSLSQHMNTWMP